MMLMTMVKENIAVLSLFQQAFSLMRQTLNHTKQKETIYN